MARKIGLSVEDVVDAAARLADEAGLDAVALAAVASRLGVRSPSLYAHVDGLPGLRRLLALRAAEALGARLETAGAELQGLAALRAISRAYRRFARAHPGLYAAAQVATTASHDPELHRALAGAVAPVYRALAALGIGAEEHVHLARALRSALHGFVTLEEVGGFGLPESVEGSFERMVELLLDGVRQASRPEATA